MFSSATKNRSWLCNFAERDIRGEFDVTKQDHAFTVSTDSFLPLCINVYKLLCNMDHNFQNNVSESMFVYYNVILLWLKIVEIRLSSEKVTAEEVHFVEYVTSKNYYVPEPIQCYLNGIGHVQDSLGELYKFVLPYLPECTSIEGLTGYFGKVNSETHAMYEAFPAPGVCAQRIIEDYKFTIEKNRTPIWNLPEALRPNCEMRELFESVRTNSNTSKKEITEPLPTMNLLGWAPAKYLTYNQYDQIAGAIFIDDKFCTDHNLKMYCFNEPICKHVSFHLGVIDRLYQMSKYQAFSNVHSKGSQTLALYLENGSEKTTFKRNAYYCQNVVRALSAVTPTAEDSVLARIFGYRIKKEDINGLSSWSCYDFNEYKNVPNSWKESRNSIFKFGSAASLNDAKYYSAYVNAFLFRTLFVNSYKK